MQTAIIIGAGPAGLTAAYELLKRSDIKPIVFELDEIVGGLSKTINHKGNRIDIGGHRFFSKSDKIMDWWLNILPLEKHLSNPELQIHYQNKTKELKVQISQLDSDKVMLIRQRLSRILFKRKLFDYPLSLTLKTVRKLGVIQTASIIFSYLQARIHPIRPEINLEQFLINRFGKKLYLTFFKDYTEKVWGQPCNIISAEWGVQRIKGLNVTKALLHSLKNIPRNNNSIKQKKVETSLIERFLYPKYGPGQLWEEVAELVKAEGGEIHLSHKIIGVQKNGHRIEQVTVKNLNSGEVFNLNGDYFISTMPIKELVGVLHETNGHLDEKVSKIADGLIYRDFLTIGILAKKIKISEQKDSEHTIKDNWIYIQESSVKVGRIQIFNNWSPFMVADPNKYWLGLEYFLNEDDNLWRNTDQQLIDLAIAELEKIGFIDKKDVEDFKVIRVPKAYPAYFGSYSQLDILKAYFDQISNLFLIGRNGMHKYNNQDHSMLTAIAAVDNIINGKKTKENIWAVNSEMNYHESK